MKKSFFLFIALFLFLINPALASDFVNFGVRASNSQVGSINMPTANLLALYSVLQQRGYNGPSMRVQRSSDNAQADVQFKNGVADIATAMTFAGSGTLCIVKWYDESGNGHDSPDVSCGTAPAFTNFNMINNIPGVTFFTGSAVLDIPTTLSTNSQSETVYAVHAPIAASGAVFQLNTVNTQDNSLLMGLFQYPDAIYNAGGNLNTGVYSNMQPEISVITSSSTSKTYNLNDKVVTGIGTTPSATSTGGLIGSLSSGGFNYLGQAYMLAIYSAVHSQTLINTTKSALYSSFSINHNPIFFLNLTGDSITEGTGSSYGVNNPFQAAPLFKDFGIVRNSGRFGQALSTGLSNVTADVTNTFHSELSINIFVDQLGESDICNNSTPEATVLANMKTYVADAKAAGFTVGVASLIYDNSSNCRPGSANDNARIQYNTDMKAFASTGGYFVVDYDSIPQLQFPQAAGYSSDGVHPTTLGYSLMAPVLANAVNPFLP